MTVVVAGGFLGAAAREAVEQALPTARGGFPAATFAINVCGAFILGALLEALVRAGDDSGWRRRTRLMAGTGFCGAFTTYSTFAVETVQLVRAGRLGTAILYGLATVVTGLLATTAGIGVAGSGRRRRAARLPVDPDIDVDGAR
ncbi:fluoride efflux transporter CrcB [Acidiferrimicrobium sp. IK]|uniref:fluoride efflux transporter CrcB n=1 Tax=Acidiferrimicrobium sp. IK TaxID=2871700 RepID=UPI0021CB7800|nr:fluoride efflux transporter CrcB [Acidiferrimicrobium sp. IK]MCU4186250.1 fluoride efflux transporter CrcB [Acidiferrimicrobium sp. IK]